MNQSTTTTITADRETMGAIIDVYTEFVTEIGLIDDREEPRECHSELIDVNNLRITGTDENIANLIDVIESYEFDCEILHARGAILGEASTEEVV